MSQTKGFSIITEPPQGREMQYVTGIMQMIFRTLLMCIKFWVATKYEHITNKSHRKIREKNVHVSASEYSPQVSLHMTQYWQI